MNGVLIVDNDNLISQAGNVKWNWLNSYCLIFMGIFM